MHIVQVITCSITLDPPYSLVGISHYKRCHFVTFYTSRTLHVQQARDATRLQQDLKSPSEYIFTLDSYARVSWYTTFVSVCFSALVYWYTSLAMSASHSLIYGHAVE
jgi:hypothetical protein